MKDKTKERGSNVYEPVNIPIERKLVDKSAGSNEVRPQGAVLKPPKFLLSLIENNLEKF